MQFDCVRRETAAATHTNTHTLSLSLFFNAVQLTVLPQWTFMPCSAPNTKLRCHLLLYSSQCHVTLTTSHALTHTHPNTDTCGVRSH